MNDPSAAAISDTPQRARAIVERTLATAVDLYGPSLFFDPARLRDLLTQATTEAPKAIELVIEALVEEVPQKLLAAGEDELATLLPRLVQRMATNRKVERGPAKWTVRTWAHALALPTAGLDGPGRALPPRVHSASDFGFVVTPLVDRAPRTDSVPDPVPPPDRAPAQQADEPSTPPPDVAPSTGATRWNDGDPVEAPSDLLPLGVDYPITVPASPPEHEADIDPPGETTGEDLDPPIAEPSLRPWMTEIDRDDQPPSFTPSIAPPVGHEVVRPSTAEPLADATAADDETHEEVAETPRSRNPLPVEADAIASTPRSPAVGKRAFVAPDDAEDAAPLPSATRIPTSRSDLPLGRKAAIAAALLVVGVLGIVLMRPFYAPSSSDATQNTTASSSDAADERGAPTQTTPAAKPPQTTASVTSPTQEPREERAVAATGPTTAPIAAVAPPPTAAEASPSTAAEAPPPTAAEASPSTAAEAPPTTAAAAPPAPVTPAGEREAHAPAITRIDAPVAVAGKPFSIAITVDGDTRRVAAIERRVVSSDTTWPSDTTTSTASALKRTKRGAFVIPFRAIDHASKTTLLFVAVDKSGARSAGRRVSLRVTAPSKTASDRRLVASTPAADPTPKANAPAAARATPCTNATCGSVASSRDVGQAGGVHSYEIIVRMDDRTIRAVVQTNNWKPGARVRFAGGRFTALK